MTVPMPLTLIRALMTWQVSTLAPGETTSDARGCDQVTPEIGITSTPVIDRQRGPNGAMYLVAMSKDSGGNYHQRLHALDLSNRGRVVRRAGGDSGDLSRYW